MLGYVNGTSLYVSLLIPRLGLVAEADVGSEADMEAGEMLTAFPSQGMGGQHNYFGLWIDVDFGKGHSKAKPTCTTYNSPQLSAQEDFRFEKMEVWAVGDASCSKLVSRGLSPLSQLHSFC